MTMGPSILPWTGQSAIVAPPCRAGGRANAAGPLLAGSGAAGQPASGRRWVAPRTRHPCRNIIARYLAEHDRGRLFFELTEPDRDDTPTFSSRRRRGAAPAVCRRRGLRQRPTSAPATSCSTAPVEIVTANFYRPAELDRVRDAVGLVVDSLPGLAEADDGPWSTTRSTSCWRASTPRTPRAIQPAASVLRAARRLPLGLRDAVRRLYPPNSSITYEGIGIATRR